MGPPPGTVLPHPNWPLEPPVTTPPRYIDFNQNCQALVQVRVQALVQTGPQSRIKVTQKKKKEGFGPWTDPKITWATHHPTPPHPPITFEHEGVLW